MKNQKFGKDQKQQKARSQGPVIVVFALVAVYLGVGVYLFAKNHAGQVTVPFAGKPAEAVAPPQSVSDDPLSKALALDSQSYGFYCAGQYQRSADMLEESVSVYQQNLDSARATGDNATERRMETLVAENYQHMGKCYLMLGKQNKSVPDKAIAHYLQAQNAYEQAMPFYRKYGNYPGSTMAEVVKDYSELLSLLHNQVELDKLKALARQNNITL